MAATRARLVFFERWFDPVAERVLSAEDDIDLVKLRYADPQADNWATLATARGYQISAGTELQQPWGGDAALLEKCPNLLAISSAGAGYDVINVEACTKAGVAVVCQSGTNSEPVAEHAIALMLGLTKRVAETNRMLLAGNANDRWLMNGHNIRGKTLGIVGIGQIGRLTAKYGAAFDMRVLAFDPYLDAQQVAARGAEKVDFATLLAESDFISVHCPRTAETRGMFDADAFAGMKPSAYFVNTARGGIHSEAALLAALRDKKIAGAGIDVFDVEPPSPNHPLLHLDNVICTPHIAGSTVETVHDMSKAAAEQWIALLRGRVPPRLVNPEVWPHYTERFAAIAGFAPDPLPEPNAEAAA